MSRHHLVLAALLALLPLTACSQYARQTLANETATPAPTRVPSAAVIAFCGPDPTAPHWRRQQEKRRAARLRHPRFPRAHPARLARQQCA